MRGFAIVLMLGAVTGCGGKQLRDPCYRSMQNRIKPDPGLAKMPEWEHKRFITEAENMCSPRCHSGWQPDNRYSAGEACAEEAMISFDAGDLEDAGRSMVSACYAHLQSACDWLEAHPEVVYAMGDDDRRATAASIEAQRILHAPMGPARPDLSGGATSTDGNDVAVSTDVSMADFIAAASETYAAKGFGLLYHGHSTEGAPFNFSAGRSYVIVLIAERGTDIDGAVVVGHDQAGNIEVALRMDPPQSFSHFVVVSTTFAAQANEDSGVTFQSGGHEVQILIYQK